MSDTRVIVLASRIGAGKSTLARELSQMTNFPIISFGKHVASVARERNLPLNRATLQNLGEELVEADPVSFTRKALGNVNLERGIVLDGLRHKSVLDEIRSLAGASTVALVFIDTEEQIRVDRLLARGMSHQEILQANKHKMETLLEERLRPLCDITIDGSQPAVENADYVIRNLRDQR